MQLMKSSQRTQNFNVEKYSNLLVKVLSTLKQVQAFAKAIKPDLPNNFDCLKTFEYVSEHISQFNIKKLISDIPSLCSPSSSEPLSITIIQKKKGFIIPWSIIKLCYSLEISKSENDFKDHLKQMLVQPQQGEGVFIESSLIQGKGLLQRGVLQKGNFKHEAHDQFKKITQSSKPFVAYDFQHYFNCYKLKIQLTDFEQLALKMKQEDYKLFQVPPLIQVVWGEKQQDAHKEIQEMFEKQLSYIYFIHTNYDFTFMNESKNDHTLYVMSVEFGLSRQDENQNFFKYVDNNIKEFEKVNSNVIVFNSQEEILAQKTSIQAIKQQYQSVDCCGNDVNFLLHKLVEIFIKDPLLQFDYSKASILPQRSGKLDGCLILWGDLNKTEENQKYYDDLRSKFKEHTVLQIYSASEMRRIPLENPNKIHIIVMSASFQNELKNNVSNLNWCQQAILEYELNCTHVILFTSEKSIKMNVWDEKFKEKHPNMLITYKFQELVELIQKENFLNQNS